MNKNFRKEKKDKGEESKKKFIDVLKKENDCSEIKKQYKDSRELITLNKESYCNMWGQLKIVKSKKVRNDVEKEYIIDIYTKLSKATKKSLKDVDNRQKLIDVIGECLQTECDRDDDIEHTKEEKFFVLYLMIDILFIFQENKEDKIKAVALLYALMKRWNKAYKDENFGQFYGQSAEQEIINHFYENIEVISRNENKKVSQWLKDILNELNSKKSEYKYEYAIQFCEAIKKEINQNSSSKGTSPRFFKKSTGLDFLRLASRSISWKVTIAAVIVGIIVSGIFMIDSRKKTSKVDEQQGENSVFGENDDGSVSFDATWSNEDSINQEKPTNQEGKIEQEGETMPNDEATVEVGEKETSSEDKPLEERGRGDEWTLMERRRVRSSKSTEKNFENVRGELEEGEIVKIAEPLDENGWLGIFFNSEICYVKIK